MKWLMVLGAIMLAGCASAKKQTASEPVKATPAAASASAMHADSAATAGKLSCTKGTDVRVLEVAGLKEGCVLNYEKFGKTSPISTARHGLKHCKDSQDKIKTKLEHGGYKCT
jgi:hypothetical protein